MTEPVRIELELEIDEGLIADSPISISDYQSDGVIISLSSGEEGHGFGLTELIDVALIISAGVASDIAADALRRAVGGIIRKAKGRSHRSDGGKEELARLIELERRVQAVEAAQGTESAIHNSHATDSSSPSAG